MTEHRPVEGFPGYTVTDDGDVWSWWRSNGRNPRRLMPEPVRRLSPGIAGSHGYEQVWLYRDGERHGRFVHLLVLAAFVGPAPEGMQARHRNGDERDNRPGNLQWGTALDNAADRDQHGTTVWGEKVTQSKLTAEQVRRARRLAASGMSYPALAGLLGVHRSTVRRAVTGERWGRLHA